LKTKNFSIVINFNVFDDKIIFYFFLYGKFNVLFFYNFNLSKKKIALFSLIFLFTGFLISYVNIYDVLPAKKLIELEVYKFFPRFHLFFLQPEKKILYELSKLIGHDPFWMLELPFYTICVALMWKPRFYNQFIIIALTYSFFFVVAFRFHFSMILRFESLFELCARGVFLWVIVKIFTVETDDKNSHLDR
jgi:hypothetical protein